MQLAESRPEKYTFKYILELALQHRKQLIAANLIAVFAVIASVPIPLLIPLLVDEILLNKPGKVVETFDAVFSGKSHDPVFYIGGILLITIVLRLVSVALNVWQTKKFVSISKDIIYKIRSQLLSRLQSIAMSEYETVGGGTVSSLFVTDLNTVDQFAGETVSKVIVSALTIVGVAAVLLWLHWQLALFYTIDEPVGDLFHYGDGQAGKKSEEKRKPCV